MTRLTLSAVVLVLLLGATSLVAQNDSKSLNLKPENIQNLELGIMSDNHGLSRSSIYLAGKYKITELVDALVKRITAEHDESMRLLIVLTLNEISSPEGMEVVGKMSTGDPDARVKKMCRLIMNEYSNSQKLVDVKY